MSNAVEGGVRILSGNPRRWILDCSQNPSFTSRFPIRIYLQCQPALDIGYWILIIGY
jgi:hypothetical protein